MRSRTRLSCFPTAGGRQKMSKKKRTAGAVKADHNGGLIDQARQIAEGAFQDFQKRLPQDLVKQLEKSLGQGQKTIQGNVQRIQEEVRRTARHAAATKQN